MICNQIQDDGTIIQEEAEEDLTVLRQYGTSPVITIVGIDGKEFLACTCGKSNLIGNYNPNLYISLAIRCSVCDQITITPKLPKGEVLPTNASLVVSGPGEYHIRPGMLLEYNGSILTTSSVSAEDQKTFRPIVEENEDYATSFMIENSYGLYDKITKGQLNRHLSIVRKRQMHNKCPDKDYPLMWALEKVSKVEASRGSIPITSEVLAAISLISSFHDVVMRWKHHYFFEKLGMEFRAAGQFYHNVFQLVAATILVRSGHRVALTALDTSGRAQRTPDMYVRYMETGKFHLEVKAPECLQLGNKNPINNELLYKLLRSLISKSQIDSNNKGIIVLIVNRFEKQLEVHNAVIYAIDRLGQGKKSLAGIMIIQSNLPKTKLLRDGTVMIDNISVNVEYAINKNFEGLNPFGRVKRMS